MNASVFKLAFWVLLATLVSGCATSQLRSVDTLPDSAVKARDAFKADERLAPFFTEAIAYAIYPNMVRAGTGFGGAWGRGWLLRDKHPIKPVSSWQVAAGLTVGVQAYRQIIFFKTEQALAAFERGSVEFASQANIAFIRWGASGTPSFSGDVSIMTQLHGGILVEASVGAHGYSRSSP